MLHIWIDKLHETCYDEVVPEKQQSDRPRQTEGGIVYKCDRCERISEKLTRRVEPYCLGGYVCGYCGSSSVRESPADCFICKRPLFDGDDAYRAGEMLFCTECVKETIV